MDRFGFAQSRRWGPTVALLLSVMAAPATAGTLFTDAGTNRPSQFGDGFSLGSRFTAIVPSLDVIALGMHFDNTGAPLQAHDMGLWDVTAGNTEVAEISMPAGGAGTSVIGAYVYMTLPTPVALVDGDQYILAAFYPTGNVAGVNDQINNCCITGSGPNTDPEFSGFQAAFTRTGSSTSLGVLSEPNSFTGGTDYAGVNMEFSQIPEPTSLSTFGLAALGVGFMRRRNDRTKR